MSDSGMVIGDICLRSFQQALWHLSSIEHDNDQSDAYHVLVESLFEVCGDTDKFETSFSVLHTSLFFFAPQPKPLPDASQINISSVSFPSL